MPKIFAESLTESWDLLAESDASHLALNLTQKSVFKSPIPFKEKGTEKTVNSKVTLHLNGQGKVERHDEEWDWQGNKSEEYGWKGKMMQARKKVNAKLVEKSVPTDPAKVQGR
ncbi:MAG: hypothetical protein Q9226_003950 [Calogaya cf. arnoldii]